MNEKKEDILYKIQVLNALNEDIIENKKIDIQAGYKKTQKKIRKQSNKWLIVQLFSRVAVILVLPLLISTLVFMYLYLNKSEQQQMVNITYTEVFAAPGTVVKTQLPDQSEVWLNSESSLRYAEPFLSDKRKIELAGEAFFDVKTDPEHPFEVSLSTGMKVIAKGTSFNISAYSDDTQHEAILQEGILDVVLGDKSITLLPNQMVNLDREEKLLRQTTGNIDEKTGWKDGLLIFRNTPLNEVFKRLSRRYNIDFDIQQDSYAEYGIWGTFTDETITQILDILKMAAPITWSVKKMEQQDDLTYTRQCIQIKVK